MTRRRFLLGALPLAVQPSEMTWRIHYWNGGAYVPHHVLTQIPLSMPYYNHGTPLPQGRPWPALAVAMRPWNSDFENHAWMQKRYGPSCPGCPHRLPARST